MKGFIPIICFVISFLPTNGNCRELSSEWDGVSLPPGWSYSLQIQKPPDQKNGIDRLGVLRFSFSDDSLTFSFSFSLFDTDQWHRKMLYPVLNEKGLNSVDDFPYLKGFFFKHNYYLIDSPFIIPGSMRTAYFELIFKVQNFIGFSVDTQQDRISISNWITIFTAIIVITGWFINSLLQRLHERAKERLKYRMEALKSCLSVLFLVEESGSFYVQQNFNSIMETARKSILVYGRSDEIEFFESFRENIRNDHVQDAREQLDNLIDLIKRRIRTELKIK